MTKGSAKKTRRGKNKYAALDPKLNLKTRQDLIDFDYLDKLSDKEKEWLNTFSEEYNNANFNHGKKVLHKTKLLKKDCYSKNNARNRCILTKAKAMGNSVYLEDLKEQELKLLKEEGHDFNDPLKDKDKGSDSTEDS